MRVETPSALWGCPVLWQSQTGPRAKSWGEEAWVESGEGVDGPAYPPRPAYILR